MIAILLGKGNNHYLRPSPCSPAEEIRPEANQDGFK